MVSDRRVMPRGGRRADDLPGRYPPVLIADGYEEARVPCATYLNLLNFEVAEASIPTEAVAVIDAGWMPHVILADPPCAQALSERLASPARVSSPPMIVMATFSGTARPHKAVVLLKPFGLEEMVKTVRRVLRRSALISRGESN